MVACYAPSQFTFIPEGIIIIIMSKGIIIMSTIISNIDVMRNASDVIQVTTLTKSI